MSLRTPMTGASRWSPAIVVLILATLTTSRAQRQVAAPVTDPKDPRFLTGQTRKMGGPMPAEQLALVFDRRS
jgi:hypothetical protein